MKHYIGTIIEKCADGQIFAQTYVSGTECGLAVLLDDALITEEEERGIEIPRDFCDILAECTLGNQNSEPLSLGEDADLSHEFLISTTIKDF